MKTGFAALREPRNRLTKQTATVLALLVFLTLVLVPVRPAMALDSILSPSSDDTSLLQLAMTGGSTHWNQVADESDGTYVAYTSSTGADWLTDRYNLADSSLSGTILSLTVHIRVGRPHNWYTTEAGARTYLRTGTGVESYGAAQTIPDPSMTSLWSWAEYSTTYTAIPGTSSAWTWADINNLQVGVSLKRSGTTISQLGGTTNTETRCSKVWVTVEYKPPFTIAPTTLTTTEGGSPVSFSIRLDAKPAAPVTIGLSSADTSEGTVTPSTVTFTADTPGSQVRRPTGDGYINSSWSPTTNRYQMVDEDPYNDGDYILGDDTNDCEEYALFTFPNFSVPSNAFNISLTVYFRARDNLEAVFDSNMIAAAVQVNGQRYRGAANNAPEPDTGFRQYSYTWDVNPYGGLGWSWNPADINGSVSGIELEQFGVYSNDLQPKIRVSAVWAEVNYTIPSNYSVPQTVTVTPVDDLVADGNVTYSIVTASATSADPYYNGWNPDDVSVTNNDNDVSGIVVSPASLTTTEGGGNTQFTVKLKSEPTSNVTVSLSSSDTTEGAVSPASLTFLAPYDGPGYQSRVPTGLYSTAGGTWTPSFGSNLYDPVADNTYLTNPADIDPTYITSPLNGSGGWIAFSYDDFNIPSNARDISVRITFRAKDSGSTGTNDLRACLWIGGNAFPEPDSTNPSGSFGLGGYTWNYNPVWGAGTTVPWTVDQINGSAYAPRYFGVYSSDLDPAIAVSQVYMSVHYNYSVEPTWSNAQTVTVSPVDEWIDDGNITYSINLSATGGDYAGKTASVSVTSNDDDTGSITVSPLSGLITTEAGGIDWFSIKLNTQPTADVTIGLSVSDPTEGKVDPTSVTFTPSSWGESGVRWVKVTGVNDDIDDGDITYSIVTAAAVSADPVYNGMNPPDVSVTNQDNDDSVPALSINDISLAEGNSGITNFVFTVSLNAASSAPVTVDYATANGTAGAGSDYNSVATTTLTFNTGETSKQIVVQVKGDTTYEPDETFFINLSNAVGATIADSQGIGTILNDDALPAWSINDVSLSEDDDGTKLMMFSVTLSSVSYSSASVQYATADGTATAGSDYVPASGTLNMGAGADYGTIFIEVIGDTIYEPDETFFINLSNPVGSTISDSQGVGTILNDDTAGTAPIVTANPVDRNIVYGADTSFTAAATGTPAPTVRWQVSTDGGSSFIDLSDGGIYSGATAATLTLTRPPFAFSSYRYRAVFTNGINPDAASTAATLTVAPLGITGSFTADDKIYNGTAAANVSGRDLTGVLPGDDVSLTAGTATFSDKNAGAGKTVTLTGATLSGTHAANYTLTSVVNATASISPKPIDPVIKANSKTYDGLTTATLSSQTLDGVISPDVVTLVVGAANFDDKNVGLDKTVTATMLSLGGTDAGNYSLSATTTTAKADITALGLTITGASAENKTYDGNNTAIVDFTHAALVGTVGTDDVTLSAAGYTATFTDKNVGNGKTVTVIGVTLVGTDAGNYTLSQPSGLTANIIPLDITGSFTAADKVYDGTTAALVLSRSPNSVLGADAVDLTGGTATFDSRNVGIEKTVTLSGASLTGADAGNYKLTSVVNATASISPKPIDPVIKANSKTYDGLTTATLSSQTLDGVISPDVVTLVVGAANFDDKNVGLDKTVTATMLSLGGTDAGNYSLSATTTTAKADITALGLTITGASAENKTYDGNNTAIVDFTHAALVGTVGTDDVTLSAAGYTATFTDKNVGNGKTVTVIGVTLVGTDAGNYTLSQPSGLTANIIPLDITGSFTAADKVYDGTTAALVLSRSPNSVLGADAVDLTGGTATFDSRNVGIEKTVTLSGASLTGADAGNYKLTSVAATKASITARPITVTAVTDSKTYDGTTSSAKKPLVTSTLGLADGDTAEWNQAFDTKDAGTGKTLSPAGAVNDGNGGANYSVTFAPVSTGEIKKATLLVTAENKTSQYSEPRAPLTATITGFVGGETIATSGVTGAPDYVTDVTDPVAQAPGDYDIEPTPGSLAAANYTFTFAKGMYTVTIEDAALSFDSQNPVSVKVVSDGGSNAAFTWRVIVSQDKDGYPGDLSKISASDLQLSFTSVGIGGGWSGPASSFDPATGVATFNIPEGKLSVETYSGKVTLDNKYFYASPAEDVLVVYDPSLGFTTGGGWFYWPAGTGNPELEGAKTNFGFTMKYNKKGNSVQGSFLLIAHLPDGGIIRIKSNAVYGLAIIEKEYPGIASFSGKCVYSRIDADGNVLSESGNQEFIVYVKDMNEPGSGVDMFWFTAKLSIPGEPAFSLDSNGNGKVDDDELASLGGGNIVVPHTATGSVPVDEGSTGNGGKKK